MFTLVRSVRRKKSGAARQPSQRNQLHPFLAFSRARGTRFIDAVSEERIRRLCVPASLEAAASTLNITANNHGFYSDFDYPCNGTGDNEDAFTVGVFGGSAAQLLALQAGSQMCDELEGTAPTNGRVPLVLNCAAGGMKQPQALLTLSYLLSQGQRFSAVVLFDGFNEAALSYSNWEAGFRPEAPSMQHMEKLTKDLDQFELDSGSTPADASVIAASIAQHWALCTRLFHDECASQGIRLVHVVQPNQYHSKKNMSEDELAWAVSPTMPYRRGVEAVYPLIAQQARTLAGAGYDVIDAMSAFDHIEETVYADNCCHYNLRGTSIIKDIVVDALLLAEPKHDRERHASSVSPAAVDVGDRPLVQSPVRPDESGDLLYPMW